MHEIYDQRQRPILPGAAEAPREIRRETRRLIRRRIWDADGREGLEEREEHAVEYARSRPAGAARRAVGVASAGFAAFILTCLIFAFMGGGDQTPALLPVYWGGFFGLWWWIARG